MYAFLDPDSSATFCTESLMHKLTFQEEKHHASYDEPGKYVAPYVVTRLKVSALEENNYHIIIGVYTKVHVSRQKQNAYKRWSL